MFGESLETVAILLYDGDRHVAGLAGVDVTDRARFTFVGTCDHYARRAVSQLLSHAYSLNRAAQRPR